MSEPINYFSSTKYSVTFHFHFTVSVSKLPLLGILKPSIRRSHISYHAYILTMMPFRTISVGPLGVMDVIRGQKGGQVLLCNFLPPVGSGFWT